MTGIVLQNFALFYDINLQDNIEFCRGGGGGLLATLTNNVVLFINR